MFNFFPKFGSCYRLPQRRRPATSDDGFFSHVGTSGDCHDVRNNRTYCRRNRPSAWRPTLSVIMEDNVYQDHHDDINVNRKSDKSRKNKSVANFVCIDGPHNKERRPKPKIYISPFAGTTYMF